MEDKGQEDFLNSMPPFLGLLCASSILTAVSSTVFTASPAKCFYFCWWFLAESDPVPFYKKLLCNSLPPSSMDTLPPANTQDIFVNYTPFIYFCASLRWRETTKLRFYSCHYLLKGLLREAGGSCPFWVRPGVFECCPRAAHLPTVHTRFIYLQE